MTGFANAWTPRLSVNTRWAIHIPLVWQSYPLAHYLRCSGSIVEFRSKNGWRVPLLINATRLAPAASQLKLQTSSGRLRAYNCYCGIRSHGFCWLAFLENIAIKTFDGATTMTSEAEAKTAAIFCGLHVSNCGGFRMPAHAEAHHSRQGRRPKALGEGTRGKQGTRNCTTL